MMEQADKRMRIHLGPAANISVDAQGAAFLGPGDFGQSGDQHPDREYYFFFFFFPRKNRITRRILYPPADQPMIKEPRQRRILPGTVQDRHSSQRKSAAILAPVEPGRAQWRFGGQSRTPRPPDPGSTRPSSTISQRGRWPAIRPHPRMNRGRWRQNKPACAEGIEYRGR